MISGATATGAAKRTHEVPEDRYYTWLKDYLETLEGKEAREEYYAWLEYELERLRVRRSFGSSGRPHARGGSDL